MTYPPAGGVASAWWGVHWGDPDDDEDRFLGHLLPGESEDFEAKGLEMGVAGAVLLERRAVAVLLPAVGLDDEVVGGPEEVDSVRADDVLRQRFRGCPPL